MRWVESFMAMLAQALQKWFGQHGVGDATSYVCVKGYSTSC